MGYKLSKTKKIIDTLDLPDGRVLEVKANIGVIAADFNKVYNNILLLQKSKATPEKAEKLSDAVIGLMTLTLGDENTSILLDYYERDYIELMEQIVPFIEGVFIPEIKKYAKDKQKAASENYKHSKRKKLGKNL